MLGWQQSAMRQKTIGKIGENKRIVQMLGRVNKICVLFAWLHFKLFKKRFCWDATTNFMQSALKNGT